jgi:hypothetical protein
MTDYAVTQAQIDQLRSTLATAMGQVDALEATPIAPPDGGGGGGGGGGGSGVVVNAGAFNWNDLGQSITVNAEAGKTYAFGWAVPTGWSGQVRHTLAESSQPIGTINIRIWESTVAGGDPIPGTLYDGSWIGGTWDGAFCYPEPGQYFFNLVVKNANGQVVVKQTRYP